MSDEDSRDEAHEPFEPTMPAETMPASNRDAGALPSEAMVGRIVAGYEIRSILGRGGMGVVYMAHDPQLGRPLALKMIRTELLGTGGKERFLREAKACSRINHPNIVTVYAAGEEDGDPYMAMEFLRGRTLREAARESTADWRSRVRWTIELLDALERLHREGIIHRDLKPDNVMVTGDGTLKLMDFGLARMDTEVQLTAAGAPMGTAHYMSPEMVMGQPVDARSDVFAIGVMLHEMLADDLPFQGDHPMSVMYAIQTAPARPLDAEALGLPSELIQCLESALAKDPKERLASAAAFADRLRAILQEPGGAASTPVSRRLAIGIVAAILLAVIAAVAFWPRGPQLPLRDRETAVLHNEVAQGLREDGKLGEARSEFHRSVLADDSYVVPWNNLAELAIEAGELAEADSLLRHAIELDPKYEPAYFHRGVIREKLGDPTLARAMYERAIEIRPDFGAAYNNLGALLAEEGRAQDARRVLEEGLQVVAPDDLSVAYMERNLGRIAVADGRDDDAVAHWTRALGGLPDDPELLQGLAGALNRLGRGAEAQRYRARLGG